MIKFFPISYYSYEDNRGVCIIIFAYDIDGNHVAIRFRYRYWFYANITNTDIGNVQSLVSHLSGITVDDKMKVMRSTTDHHKRFNTVMVYADTTLAKKECMRIFSNHSIPVHEADNVLVPILKLLAEKDIKKYQWLSVDIGYPADKITTFQQEYIGLIDTLCPITDEIPPPKLSILSFDIETNSTRWNRMPDAKGDIGNSINIIGATFKSTSTYKEYAIVYGPNAEDVYDMYKPSDKDIVTIYTYRSEVEAIAKLFHLISDLNPDVITGHNVITFDNLYIHDRWRLTIMTSLSSPDYTGPRSTSIPNISRLRDHAISVRNVEWNNSQVAVNGIYFDSPGRIWLDTLVVTSRGLLGNLPNGKLDTLGKVILGMEKNEMTPKTMFQCFDLHNKWQQVKTDINCPFSKKDIQDKIYDMYKFIINSYDKVLPPPKEPSLSSINELILLINVMNQRGKKLDTLGNEVLIMDKDRVKELYDKYRDQCIGAIEEYNIPMDIEPTDDDSYDRMVKVMWMIVILYCLQDTRIPYQVIENRAIIPMLIEQGSTFSVDISDVLMRGQVYTTTCSQYKFNYKRGFMMDFGNHGGPITPFDYEGGYVGKGEAGLKIQDNDTFLFVIDFASLYPTIIIAYNLCYTTWIPYHMRDSTSTEYIYKMYEDVIPDRYKELYDIVSDTITDTDILQSEIDMRKQYYHNVIDIPIINRKQYTVSGKYNDDIEKYLMYLAELSCIMDVPYDDKGKYMSSIFIINNVHTGNRHEHWFLRASVLPGVVPDMLWDDFLTRKAIKRKMDAAKKRGDIAMYITYNAQQTGIKLKMNATYGGLGTKTNRLANYAAAEVITWVGRMSIQKVNEEVDIRNIGHTVYNDTDSAMVAVSGIRDRFNNDPSIVKDHGINAAKELSSIFPKPISLECENFFISFFLRAPKMYAGIKWDGKSLDINTYTKDYVDAKNLLYIKGMAPVKRDKYKYNKDLFSKILFYILIRLPVDGLIYILEDALRQMWKLNKPITTSDKHILDTIEKLFSYNMGITPKSITSVSGTMSQWSKIYADKYGRTPVAGERFDLLVTNVHDCDKHTKSAPKLVTMEWLLEEGRQLDVEHYILQLAGDGNVADIMHIAYPNNIPRTCIEKHYLRLLKAYGTIN